MNPAETFIRRAITLAMRGRGDVEPNPMVGCVIAREGRIIGEGYHAKYGQPHAEPTALASCGEDPRGATAYVTLEPCCHVDKQTPPCGPRLIAAGIARVVIGCRDPNPQVDGKGIGMLRSAGIDVIVGVLEAECGQLIAPFIAGTKFGRPYVTLKWAESADGMVSAGMGRPIRLTNHASYQQVHEMRARCDAIAVGTNTILSDDPLLTVRIASPHRPLLRVVLSNSLKIPIDARVVQSARQAPTVIYCSERSAAASGETVSALRSNGVDVIELPDAAGRFAMGDALRDLQRRGVMHLLIEPGPTLAKVMQGYADRAWVFRSSRALGDGMRAAGIDWPAVGRVSLTADGVTDELTEYLNPASDVFFASIASADFERVRGGEQYSRDSVSFS